MPLAQHLAQEAGLWSPGLPVLWSAALSAQFGEDRFGDRRIVLAHAGLIIPSTVIAGITPVDGIIIKLTLSKEVSTMMLRGCRIGWRLPCFAAGILSLSVASAWAFTRESVSPDDGNYSFTDPNSKLTDPDNHNSGQSARPFSNGPVVQFGIQQGGPFSPLSRSNGYDRSLPDPYYRPLLNGN
jgi:hypothetical protein